ncbi:hypothetical protein CLOLEP_00742 [[Clostridium] leptum DSM 753]|uniref:Uncharacterized protein n=1 Tax=[Clostridium] leptum DSM 753 TaxID=428125 RepID=A7VQB4_9FIRM|nr:hypothetical protein CLOLEP_00742 [[Clostridium] leptum DSM 753]
MTDANIPAFRPLRRSLTIRVGADVPEGKRNKALVEPGVRRTGSAGVLLYSRDTPACAGEKKSFCLKR